MEKVCLTGWSIAVKRQYGLDHSWFMFFVCLFVLTSLDYFRVVIDSSIQ